MKKFYKLVSIHKDPATALYQIHLDSRPVKCPSGKVLAVPTQTLATAIMKEWMAQETKILPDTMPLTQILTTCQDRVSKERTAMSHSLFKYFDTDLLCYRAAPQPPEQPAAQEKVWNPWLEWFETRFGVPLQTTAKIAAIKHHKDAHKAVRDYVESLDDHHFTALQLVVSLSGSLVLGLAALERTITPQQIFDAAHVEEHFKAKIYNEELYGPDPQEEKKDAAMIRDLNATAQFLELLETSKARPSA